MCPLPTLQALLAFAVLPDEVPERGLDLKQFYFDNRRYLVLLLVPISILDWIWVSRWATLNHAYTDPSFWWHFLPPATITSLLLVVIYFSKSWRMQLTALIASLLVAQYAFAPWYIDTVPGP